MVGRPPERSGVVHDNAVVNHGHGRRRVELVRGESRRREHDVVGLPLSWPARRVDEGWKLTVHGGRLTVRVGWILEAVQHLNLEDAGQKYTAVAAPLALAFDCGGRRELDVKLNVAELALRSEHPFSSLENAGSHRPAGGRSVVSLPVRQIVSGAQKDDRIAGRCWEGRWSWSDDGRSRPLDVVNPPFPIRLKGRVVVPERTLLTQRQCRGREYAGGRQNYRKTCTRRRLFRSHFLQRASVKAYKLSPAPTTTNCRPSSMNVIGAFDGLAASPARQIGSPVD